MNLEPLLLDYLPRENWPDDAQQSVALFESWNAVVDFRLFRVGALAFEQRWDRQLHSRAALWALEEIKREIETEFPFRMTIDESQLAPQNGKIWAPHEFFGPHFNMGRGALRLRGRGKNFLNTYFEEPYTETENRRVPYNELLARLPSDPSDGRMGFAYALCEPPYSLSHRERDKELLNSEINAAFGVLCKALFGKPESLVILGWPLESSNYFEAGLEWWGSFFWTVYAPSREWIVVIAASSTD